MRPDAPIKIVSQLLDLPLIDKDGRWCGVVDDVELDGTPGKKTRIKALLVGPGAYEGRLPRWAFWLVRKIAGDRIARVPFDQVENIASAAHLKCRAEDVKLHRTENEARRWIPKWGAL
jgi:sporulation protein YlmC with PRC-barrel domain